jgi:hypothetical protein
VYVVSDVATGPPDNLPLRVVYALMLPSARLAQLVEVPLRDLGSWFQMASFHETRRRGLKMREAAQVLGVSMRKVALLSKQLKQGLVEPDAAHGLPRQIEFMLWAAPLSVARIAQALDEEQEAVTEALQTLLGEGRVSSVPGRTVTYRVVRGESRLVRPEWSARLDALNRLLESVANTVYGRFFAHDERTFARTVDLRVRREDLGELTRLYNEVLWPALVKLDEAAKDAENSGATEELTITILWAPYGHPEEIYDMEDPK